MKSRFTHFLLCLVLCSASVLSAATRPTFLTGAPIDAVKILPGPTAPGSPETKSEIETVLQKQVARTAEDEARSKREGNWSPSLFDDVLGPWFTAANLPLTMALLDTVGYDTMAVCEKAKKRWTRPRPSLQDPRVQPAVGLPTTSSYPSGHGAYGLVLGAVLAELAPDLKTQLIKRGEQIGDDRVLGGVHFPSDVEAGRTLGRAVLDELRANPQFQAALRASQAEFTRLRAENQK